MNGTYLVLPLILLILAFRIWRTGGRERPISMGRLWILPLIFMALVGASIYAQPVPVDVAVIDAYVIAVIAGFGAGWFRGRATQIAVDPETGGLKARTTPIGLLIIAVLVVVRMSARNYLNAHAAEWNVSPIVIIDGFMLFALGLILGWRIEMLLRCRRLLQQAGTAATKP